MEQLILILITLIAAETTYLSYASMRTRQRHDNDSILCDTSALIDGRIVSIATSGFLSTELIVPKSVLRELQYMADGSDHDKRERARYGLDVVKELQAIDHVTVTIIDDGKLGDGGVDEQLIRQAKASGARLCTTDYNLNKVATAEGITVINVNELAHAIRSVHLPGEQFKVQIVAKGQGKEQGVGYLDDGTMVVVDGAKKYVQSVVSVEVTRMLQTEAGRMVFARLVTKHTNENTKPSSTPRKTYKPNGKENGSFKKKSSPPRKGSEDSLVELANS